MDARSVSLLALLTALGVVAASNPVAADADTDQEWVRCTTDLGYHGCKVSILGPNDATVRCGVLATGYNCGFGGSDLQCTQGSWGVHQPGFVVGGNSGCHVMAWVDTSVVVIEPPVSCSLAVLSHSCTTDVTGRDTGVACGVLSVGYSCGVLGVDCAQVLWGLHGNGLVVGGYNGCHAMVWVDPSFITA